jgi:hypothetical protein|eukprot:COSAG01_NODE_5565_length_4179_cov_28.199392_4_plen_49_part_00
MGLFQLVFFPVVCYPLSHVHCLFATIRAAAVATILDGSPQNLRTLMAD